MSMSANGEGAGDRPAAAPGPPPSVKWDPKLPAAAIKGLIVGPAAAELVVLTASIMCGWAIVIWLMTVTVMVVGVCCLLHIWTVDGG